MPTIRRPGAPPPDPHAPAPAAPGTGGPPEHSLSHLSVPAETTPTWELEMLVSGAVLVGLFQLPPVINGAYQGLTARLELGAAQMANTFYVVAFVILYLLMGSFVVHLAARTYWVALVGLDSVFPNGIDWDRVPNGPITNDVLKGRVAHLPVVIERVDNFCSVIFAFALLIASIATFAFAVTTVASGVGLGLSNLIFGHFNVTLVNTAIVLGALSMVVIPMLDRRIGARLRPDSWLARVIRGYTVINYRFLGMRIYGPIMATLLSRLRRRFVSGIMVAALFGAILIVFLQRTTASGEIALNAYTYAPSAARLQTVSASTYADQRVGGAASAATPFIQSDMIRDPYVRLFVPYLPQGDNAVLARCPGTRTGAADARAAAAIGCLARLHAVAVNGRPRPDLDFRFYTDPQSGLKGILTYIAVADLPRGRNVITLHPSPPPPGVDVGAGPSDILIPFWL